MITTDKSAFLFLKIRLCLEASPSGIHVAE
jgi:hypothetical protein